MIKTSIIGQALDVRVIYTVSVQVFFLLLTYRIVILTFSYTAYWLSTDIQYVYSILGSFILYSTVCTSYSKKLHL